MLEKDKPKQRPEAEWSLNDVSETPQMPRLLI